MLKITLTNLWAHKRRLAGSFLAVVLGVALLAGTLGWTMAAGSGKAIADLVSGRKPDIDFNFVGY